MLVPPIVNAQTFRGGEIFRIGTSDVYWAACVQMVLNYQGVNVDQEDVVRRAKGYRVNEGGTAYDIQRAADGWHTNGHTIVAKVDNAYYATAQTFICYLIDSLL